MIIGYLRVSTKEQSVEAQKQIIQNKYQGQIEKWFNDEAESGVIKALQRPQFKQMSEFVREGDIVVVAAIDRLGRNTIDVLETVQFLREKGVSIVSLRENFDLTSTIGSVLLTIISAFAELERNYIKERQMAGIHAAKKSGKKLGRKPTVDLEVVRKWRIENKATISQTAQHFGISVSSVKRAGRLSNGDF